MTIQNEYSMIISDSMRIGQDILKEGENLKVDKRKLEISMARAQLNRDTLAEKAGMPIPTVCNVYKRGSCKPATVGRIAAALEVDVTEILADE